MTNIGLEFTVQNGLDQTGYLVFSAPKWNAGTQSRTAIQSMFQFKQSEWNNQEQAYAIPCVSEAHPMLECFFKPSLVSTSADIANVKDFFKISGLANKINLGGSIKIQTLDSRFRNPPSTAPVATFGSQSYRSDGSLIDQQTSGISYKINTPYLLESSAVTMTTRYGEINVLDQYTFTILLPLPMPVGAAIDITIPPTISIFSDQERRNLILNSIIGNPPLYSVPDVTVVDANLQKIRINNLAPQARNYQDEGNPVVFTLLLMKNPGSTQETAPFELAMYDQESIIFNVNQNGFTFKATPGTLDDIKIIPDNFKVRAKVNYRFSFIIRNNVFKGSKIAITLPEEILVYEKELRFTPIQTVNPYGTITFAYNPQTRNLEINKAFLESFAAPSQIIFDLFGLQNGISTKPTAPFVIQTLDPQGKIIDKDNSEPLVFAANEISKIVADACADKPTASETEDICAYRLKFLIGAEYPIMPDSSIEIEFPEDLELVNPALTRTNSTTDGIADMRSQFFVQDSSETTFSSDKKRQVVTVKNGFAKNSAPNGVDWRQDSFSVTIAGIRSPRSTAPTLSFKVRIITPDGYVSYKKEQGVYSNVYQAQEFSIANIKRSNETNGDMTGYYNFTVQLSTKVYKNEYFKITPPTGVEILPGGDQCSSFAPLQQSLSCTLSNKSLYIMILPDDLSIDYFEAETFLTFKVRLISNPLTLRPTESFKLYISSSISQDYYVNQIVSGVSILNISPGALINVGVSPDNNSFGVVTDYKVTFTTANLTPKGSTVQIRFPSEHYPNLTKITCVPLKAVQSITCGASPQKSNVLVLQNVFNKDTPSGAEIGFKLIGVKNPDKSLEQSVVNSQFSITTVASDGFAIDQTLNPDLQIGCTYPCGSCEKIQTKCTSCAFSKTDPTFRLKLDKEQNTCLLECPPGQYADAKQVCQACAYPCERCNSGKDVCDSCLETSGVPYLFEGTCYATCPEGLFLQKATRTCEKCVGNCETCLSQSECISCKNGSYFYEGACVEQCPETSIPFESSIVKECQKCQKNCFSCKGDINTCTSCLPGFFFHESKCLETCPRNYKGTDKGLCYRASEFTLPFVTMVVTLGIVVTIAISSCKTPNTRNLTSFLALESAWRVAFMYYYLAFLIKDGHSASTLLVAFALVSNYVLNWIFYEFYKDRLLKEDSHFNEYKEINKPAQNQIMNWSMILSFQLFRLTYCGMFNEPKFMCKMGIRSKYYKRMNRYTLFQVTFVFIPIITANIYNLFYTWPGRQVFWIDLESLIMTLTIFFCHCIVIFKTQKEYLLEIFNLDEDETTFNNYNSKNKRRKIPVDAETRDVADQMADYGLDEARKQRIKDMTKFQRVGLLQSLYDRLFRNKQSRVDAEDFRLKHGRGQDFTNQHMPNLNDDDGPPMTLAADFTEGSEVLIENRPQKSIAENGKMVKMLYSSNHEENEQGVLRKEETKEKFYEEINATQTENDISNIGTAIDSGAVRRNQHYMGLRQDTSAIDLTGGVLGDIDDLRMSSVVDLDSGLGSQLKLKSDTFQEREQMINTGSNFLDTAKSARKVAQNMQQEDQDLDPESRNFSSAPINSKSALRGNNPLKKRHEALQEELMRLGHKKKNEVIQDEKGLSRMLKMDAEDSDDIVDNFQSEIWGQGTTKVVANHYKSLHDRNAQKARNGGCNEALTVNHFLEIGNLLAKSRITKQTAKANGIRDAQERARLEAIDSAEKAEIERLRKMLNDLNSTIAAELARLRAAEDRKRRDIDFVENAFYTSNEEGMGVSPGTFDAQNRMPKRPGTKSRSPKKEIPFNDPILQPFADQVEKKKSIKKLKSATRSPKRRASPQRKEKPMSKSNSFIRRTPSYGQGGGFGYAVRIIPDVRKEKSPKIRERTLSSNMSQKMFRNKRGSQSHRSDSVVSGKSKNRNRSNQRKAFNIQRVNEEDEFEYYTSQDEHGQAVKKLRRRRDTMLETSKSPRRSRSPAKVKVSPRTKRVKKIGAQNATVFEPAQTQTSKFSYTPHQQPRGRSLTNTQEPRMKYEAPIEESPKEERARIRNNDSALRNSGKMILETNTSKRKTKSKKPVKDYQGVYFKHTNFERAVIATNGRAPYNNKELEVITKPEGFDPTKFEFKNDWVNHLINSEVKKEMARQRAVEANQSSFGRESHVAATIYKGQVPSESVQQYRAYPEGITRGDYNRDRPMSGLTHDQMLHESPVSMLNRNPSEAKYGRGQPPIPRGAAPELTTLHTMPSEQSVQIIQEVPVGVKAPNMQYEMPSKNYFNHLNESTEDK